MVLFLYGDDSAEIHYKYRQLLNRFQEKNKDRYTLQIFGRTFAGESNGQKDEIQNERDIVERIFDFLKTDSIFGFKKIAIISNFEDFSAEEQKRLYNFLEETNFFENKLEFLLIRYNGLIKPKHKKSLAGFLEYAVKQKFEVPRTHQAISRKIVAILERNGLKIEAPALYFLALRFKNEPEFISQELERIVPYFIYKKMLIIKRSELEKVVFQPAYADKFSFLNALLARDYKTIFSMMDRLIKDNEVDRFIYHLRTAAERFILIKSMPKSEPSIICRKLKIHPYYYKKLIEGFRGRSTEELKKIYQRSLEFIFEKERGSFRDRKLAFSLFILDELFSEK